MVQRLLPPMPWDPILEALPPMPWEPAVQNLADSTGFAPDQLRYTISLLVAIPLGFVFKAVTSDPYKCKTDAAKAAAVANRHSLAGIIGVLFMVFVFGWDIGHALFSGTVSFVLMHIVPTKTVHIWVTVWAMGYMSCSHIYRQIVAYGSWEVDFTTPQLLLTQKMMNIAFALHDSSRDPAKCSEEQRKRMIKKPLGFIEYYGYIFCMHTLLAGPSADYCEYVIWIDGTKLAGANHSPLMAVIKRIGLAVVCLFMFIGLGSHMPISVMGDYEWLTSHAWYYVIMWNQVALYLARHRYYFAWVLSDAACNAAGLGFNGIDSKGVAKWDAVLNIKYFNVECATNFRAAMTGWNIATSNWLRRCVYERVPASIATLSSFTMSAIWHGFYPGYYLTFISCALWNESAKVMRRHIRPLILPNKEAEASIMGNIYGVVTTCLTMMSLNYLGHPFNVQSFDKSINLWKYWGFAPHIVATTILFVVPAAFPIKKKAVKKD